MTTYNHAFTVAFSMDSADPTGENVTAAELRAALLARIADLDAAGQWIEAVGMPFDTYEKEPEPGAFNEPTLDSVLGG